jgi:siroheme synthase-like protein
MGSFLLNLSLHGQHGLVIGGDAEAHTKAEGLRAAGAVITVCWPVLCDPMSAWVKEHDLRWERRAPTLEDLDARPLVSISTPRDETLSSWMHRECTMRGLLHCCVDQPSYSNFAHVALGRAGFITVGIASNGAAPGLIKRLRDAVVAGLDDEFQAYATALASLRSETPAPRRRALLEEALHGLELTLHATPPKGWRAVIEALRARR